MSVYVADGADNVTVAQFRLGMPHLEPMLCRNMPSEILRLRWYEVAAYIDFIKYAKKGGAGE